MGVLEDYNSGPGRDRLGGDDVAETDGEGTVASGAVAARRLRWRRFDGRQVRNRDQPLVCFLHLVLSCTEVC